MSEVLDEIPASGEVVTVGPSAEALTVLELDMANTDDIEDATEREPGNSPNIQDATGMYLHRIGRTALLSAEEEVDLSKQIEAGLLAEHKLSSEDSSFMDEEQRELLAMAAQDGKDAKTAMIEANLRLVVWAAKRYARRDVALLDLVQEGNLGLIRAVEKFDYTKGYKFSTYGTWWIRQAIAQGYEENARSIRIPPDTLEQVTVMKKTSRQLAAELDRDPTHEELATAMEMKPKKLAELKEYTRLEPKTSFNEPIGYKDGATFGDMFNDDNTSNDPVAVVERDALPEVLHSELQDVLTERQQAMIAMRFGFNGEEPMTFNKIGQKMGVSDQGVANLQNSALKKLRAPAVKYRLQEFLD